MTLTQIMPAEQEVEIIGEPTVFVVDDDQAVCHSLGMLVESMGLSVQTYTSGPDFLDDFDNDWYGCIVLDICMQDMSGFELQSQLVDKGNQLPIIFITAYANVPMAVQALQSGAIDFIEKPVREQVLWKCIQKALGVGARFNRVRSEQTVLHNRLSLLSEKELEVTRLLIDGKQDKQIAIEMDISRRTVSFHRNNILQKIECDGVVDMAVMLARTNISL